MTDGGDYNIPFAFLKKRGDKYFCPLVPIKTSPFFKRFCFSEMCNSNKENACFSVW